jgi:hypothetical protein
MLVGNILGTSLFLGVSMNAGLKVGGIVAAIVPAAGVRRWGADCLALDDWLIGLAVAYSGGYSI